MHTLIENASVHRTARHGGTNAEPHILASMSEFGKALATAIKRAGLVQEQLAELTGLAQETISRIVTGDTAEPKANTWRKIATVFGLNGDELLEGIAPRKIFDQASGTMVDREKSATTEPRVEREDTGPTPEESEEGIDVEALSRAISAEHAAGQWSDAEVERARRFVRETRRMLEPEADLRSIARDILRAVRRAGVDADDRKILVRWAQGKPGPERHT